MKIFCKFKGEYQWFTELGTKIAQNDLLNEMSELIKNSHTTDMNALVKFAHDNGMRVRIELKPNKPTRNCLNQSQRTLEGLTP